MLSAVLAGGHVLLEDFPGLGKTLAARSFAQTLGLEFRRAQFTPDLLPGDLTGSFIYDQRAGDFAFRKGPLFTGLLLADEINRTPPKTQSALLEAMQERQITVEGETFVLPRPFVVLATANPVEYEGTYPLARGAARPVPDAGQLRLPERRGGGRGAATTARAAAGGADAATRSPTRPASLAMQAHDRDGHGRPTISRYCVDLTAATRTQTHVMVGASPRGALGLLLAARASRSSVVATTWSRRTSRRWLTPSSPTG